MNKDFSIRYILMGFIVGIASILPGVSGGLIAVLCGIYERIVNDLSDVFRKIKTDFWFIAAVGGGFLLGMFAAAVGLNEVMGRYPIPCLFFFIGLIAAQIPSVYKMAKTETKVTAVQIVCLLFGLGIMIALMLVGTGEGSSTELEHTLENAMLLLLSGIIVGISKIVPGISGSSLLLALGLFQVSISVMANLDFFLLIPFGIGLLIGIFGFAKIMSWLIENHHSETYYAILGLTVGSLAVIYSNTNIVTVWDAVIAIVSVVLGVAVSYLFVLYGRKKGDEAANASV